MKSALPCLYNLKWLELCLVRYSLSRFFREANLNGLYIYPVKFACLICRRRKRNKTSVLQRVFAIVFAKSIFEQSFSHLYNLINLECVWLSTVGPDFFGKPISMANIFIRLRSPVLFAGGVREIAWVYCTGM